MRWRMSGSGFGDIQLLPIRVLSMSRSEPVRLMDHVDETIVNASPQPQAQQRACSGTFGGQDVRDVMLLVLRYIGVDEDNKTRLC